MYGEMTSKQTCVRINRETGKPQVKRSDPSMPDGGSGKPGDEERSESCNKASEAETETAQ